MSIIVTKLKMASRSDSTQRGVIAPIQHLSTGQSP